MTLTIRNHKKPVTVFSWPTAFLEVDWFAETSGQHTDQNKSARQGQRHVFTGSPILLSFGSIVRNDPERLDRFVYIDDESRGK